MTLQGNPSRLKIDMHTNSSRLDAQRISAMQMELLLELHSNSSGRNANGALIYTAER